MDTSFGPRRVSLATIIVLAVALGLVLGLLVGWGVVPVSWYNTDPSDLRLQHQIDYVRMVADSFAATGDVEGARARLYELIDPYTNVDQVSNLVERVAVQSGNESRPDEADRVRRMAQAVGLPAPTIISYVEPGQRAARPRGAIFWGLGVLAVGVLMGLGVWAIRRLPQGAEQWEEEVPETVLGSADEYNHSSAFGPGEEEPIGTQRSEEPPLSEALDENGGAASPQALHPVPPLPEAGADSVPLGRSPVRRPPLTTPLAAEYAPQGADMHTPPWEEPEVIESDVEPEPTTLRAAAHRLDARPANALGVFTARYDLGDDDLDLSFVIESPQRDFLGECGMGIIDVLRSDGQQQVDALEIWLFDKNDARAEAKAIVASEYACRNSAVSARLGARGRLIQAEADRSLSLETLSLRLTARIVDYGYASDSQRPNSYFAHLEVELTVQRNTAGESPA